MIKTAITGGGTPDGGELIRLLAMHPDVDLTAIHARGLEGTKVCDRHHGLIGETNLSFVSEIDTSKCDVLFVCPDELSVAQIERLRLERPELKLILFRIPDGLDAKRNGIVYGLPEVNRKLLVRGATAAVVPESFATMALVSLFPFAQNLLLNGDIRISVTAPESIIDKTDLDGVKSEIMNMLPEIQSSFNGDVIIEARKGDTRRSALMDIEFASSLTLQQMLDLYDVYDDHNFTFATTQPIGVSEVAGTDKCVISISRTPGGEANLRVAADCRLRGASGDAVHIMNLMFGLHEKTGLSLKASDFEPIS